MVTSDRTPSETREYFNEKGFDTFISYSEIVKKDLFVDRHA
jgi:hypothetical protein